MSTINTGEIFYTHDDMKRQTRIILRKMSLRGFRPEYIAAVSKGGLIAGVYFAHYFDAPLLCLTMDNANKQPKHNVALHEMVNAIKENKNVLLIDDICDIGVTLRNIWNTVEKMCPGKKVDGFKNQPTAIEQCLHTAVLIYNEAEDLFWPDYIGEVINKSENRSWIVFDWESWWM